MFCNQCEQTAKGIACTTRGVCGKTAETAALQDLLMIAVKDLSAYAHAARQKGVIDDEINHFTLEALFATLTNVNFDPECFKEYISQCESLKQKLEETLNIKGYSLAVKESSLNLSAVKSLSDLIKLGKTVELAPAKDKDIKSLQQIVIYAMRGIAAYAHHAELLGQENDQVYAFIHEVLPQLDDSSLGLDDWINIVLQCGKINFIAMELLDKGNTLTFGHPVPTTVPLGHKQGKCILVSGHDLKDLKDLLESTQGKGINIYTHGEMLPAHGYPELKKYDHFYGHYGTAWQNQRKEFVDFPGPILMTTNCIQEPQASYFNNIYTTGPVGWPGVVHLNNGDFAPLIEASLNMPGFKEDQEQGSVMCGFAHQTVLSIADKVIAGVKAGKIKHFFLVGGCDGARAGRSYYTEFVEKTPDDTIVLTLGCGKFRFFDKKLGEIDAIPRLLDVGQCNDAYSAIQIALALANAFDCGVNDLPLSLVLSWYEQKAVSILLTLLYLGIKDIRLGPTLPAFISPNVLNVLVENYGIKPITTAEEDLQAILG
ncbi:MAG: hydroxylamine reductase [Syntrophomonadaceae bacterium]|nr:hydroxylamine reductase [Syntrophomonadaceae bacterium]MDD3889476.1 hydroxylamine reductase [Syntrophomonadaceae bacterium]MDD4549970.1 hydroxylamine reductase [Syntrophomonadaceae bacterium]